MPSKFLSEIDIDEKDGESEYHAIILDRINEYLERTRTLLAQITTSLIGTGVENAQKFFKIVQNEEKFLEKLLHSTSKISLRNVNSGNLIYFESIFELSQKLSDVVAVYKDFNYYPSNAIAAHQADITRKPSKQQKNNVRVDLVANGGLSWIRVKASTRGIRDSSDDEASDEDDSSHDDEDNDQSGCLSLNIPPKIIPRTYKIAMALVDASKQNLLHYRQPNVIFHLMHCNIPPKVLSKLKEMGCQVSTKYENCNLLAEVAPNSMISEIINLDVSTLLALVSNICHLSRSELSSLSLLVKVPAMLEQIEDETKIPLLDQIQKQVLTKATRIITCQYAFDRFKHIVNTMGGPTEKQHMLNLIEKGFSAIFKDCNLQLEVVPDSPSDRFQSLKKIIENCDGKNNHAVSASLPKLSAHHITIFGTGDKYKSTTISANRWVGNALKHLDDSKRYAQHFADISIWTHFPRSLCEKKCTIKQ